MQKLKEGPEIYGNFGLCLPVFNILFLNVTVKA